MDKIISESKNLREDSTMVRIEDSFMKNQSD